MRLSAAAFGAIFTLTAAVLPAGVMAQQGGPGGRQGGPRGVMGRITAKGENSLDVQPMRRGEAGEVVKVALEADTRYSRLEVGAAADLAEGYLVVVAGDRDGGKMAARGVLRLSKAEEKPNRDEVRAGVLFGMFLNRMTGRAQRPGQGQPGGMRALMPVIGKVISTQPLTVETIALPMHPDQQAERVEIQGTDAARIFCTAPAKLEDLKAEGMVLVVPKEGAGGQAVTARAVFQLPQMGPGAGGQR